MSAGNLATRLRRSPRPDTMQAYDALPPEARRWLAGAKLPWSARSVAKLWAQAWFEAGGDLAAIRARMDAAQARKLVRDAAGVWGQHYPAEPPATLRPVRKPQAKLPFWQALNTVAQAQRRA